MSPSEPQGYGANLNLAFAAATAADFVLPPTTMWSSHTSGYRRYMVTFASPVGVVGFGFATPPAATGVYDEFPTVPDALCGRLRIHHG